jgi:guanylate kinase
MERATRLPWNGEKANLNRDYIPPHGKIFVIAGKAAVGKDTLAADVSRELGIKKNINYTTRPPRDGELGGLDYHFIEFEEFKDENFIAVQQFNSVMGKIKYGIKKSDIPSIQNCIIIATPSGFRELKEHFGDRVVGIYVMGPQVERWARYLKRGKNDQDAQAEAQRRFYSDNFDFHDFEFEVDHILLNKGEYLDTLCRLMGIISSYE